MQLAHALNVALHVVVGCCALVIGFIIVVREKGTLAHRRLGRTFCHFTILVCAFTVVGLTFFRYIPLFAVLSVLVIYQLVGGWHTVYTQQHGPSAFDAVWTILAATSSVWIASDLLGREVAAPMVVYSTLGALGIVVAYDALRWLFPRRWYASLWRDDRSLWQKGARLQSSIRHLKWAA